MELTGDGTTSQPLPELGINCLNRGCGRADLEAAVADWNKNYAGTKDALGKTIPAVVLPGKYALGDNFSSQDVRLTKTFKYRERWKLSLIGEVFNAYNKANLTGYSGDLTRLAFGQPTSRFTQVFGSGGPRAFQVALRAAF